MNAEKQHKEATTRVIQPLKDNNSSFINNRIDAERNCELKNLIQQNTIPFQFKTIQRNKDDVMDYENYDDEYDDYWEECCFMAKLPQYSFSCTKDHVETVLMKLKQQQSYGFYFTLLELWNKNQDQENKILLGIPEKPNTPTESFMQEHPDASVESKVLFLGSDKLDQPKPGQTLNSPNNLLLPAILKWKELDGEKSSIPFNMSYFLSSLGEKYLKDNERPSKGEMSELNRIMLDYSIETEKIILAMHPSPKGSTFEKEVLYLQRQGYNSQALFAPSPVPLPKDVYKGGPEDTSMAERTMLPDEGIDWDEVINPPLLLYPSEQEIELELKTKLEKVAQDYIKRVKGWVPISEPKHQSKS